MFLNSQTIPKNVIYWITYVEYSSSSRFNFFFHTRLRSLINNKIQKNYIILYLKDIFITP